MLNGNFPVESLELNNNILPIIKPDDIELYIELNQLGNDREKIYIHHLNTEPMVNIC